MPRIFSHDGEVPIEEVSTFLGAQIAQFEQTHGEEPEDQESREELAQLYLERALVEYGQDSVVYITKALYLNPSAKADPTSTIVVSHEVDDATGLEATRQFVNSRSLEHISVIDTWMESVRRGLDSRGKSQLEIEEFKKKLIDDGEIYDPIYHDIILSGLSDEDLHKAQLENNRRGPDLRGFMNDFAIMRETKKRNIARWKKGIPLPAPTLGQIEEIFGKDLPGHIHIHPEALGSVKIEQPEKRYPEIDDISEQIMQAVVDRLPRKLSAYRYHQGNAEDTIEIPGLGKLKVKLSGGDSKAFTYVSSVEGDSFKIHNCRRTGRTFMNRFSDISRPNDVQIKPLELTLHFYGDNSGNVVESRGVRYSGYGNKLTPDSDAFRFTSDERIANLAEKYDMKYNTYPGKELNKFMRKIKRPGSVSWRSSYSSATNFLKREVLPKILETEKNTNQIETLPEETPYPESFGPLYGWIPGMTAFKLVASDQNPSNVHFYERNAIAGTNMYRLISLGTPGDYPREANDGYFYCGIGEATPNSSPENYETFGSWPSTDLETRKAQLVQINPKTADGIFVVDWEPFLEARRNYERDKTEPSEDPIFVVARTLTPLADYDGSFKTPLPLITRSMAFDEVELVDGVIYEGY